MPMMAAARTELVATMYQAAMEPDLWHEAVTQLAGMFNAVSGLVMILDGNGKPPVWLAGNAWSAKAHRLYAEHYHTVDPLWLAHQRSGAGRVMLMTDMVPADRMDDMEIWYDFARHHGSAYHAMVATVDLQDGLQAALAVHRPRGASPFDEQCRAEMAEIARHGQSALRLRQRLDGRLANGTVCAAVLDRLLHGVLVADAQGRIVYANRGGEGLAAQAGLRLSALGGGLADCPGAGVQLLRLVREACAGQAGGNVRLPTRKGETPIAATVAPLPVSMAAQMPAARNGAPGLALISLFPLVTRSSPEAQRAIDIFGLTATEAALLPALMAGDTTERIARARGVSHHTVRTHVRAILAKTGTASLRTLSALMFSFPAG